MIIASDQTAARAYADLLTKHHRRGADGGAVRRPGLLGPHHGSSPQGTSRWLVAVRMVSEGVDVPRLAVGVYATSASTPLFFAQAIGRFVRSRRPGETASIFLPSVPNLLQLASELEAQRNHVLGKPHRESEGESDWTPTSRASARTSPSEMDNGFEIAGRRRRTGSGDLRRLVVRHRHPGGQRRGGRLPRHPRPARRRADARPAAPPPGRAAARSGPRRAATVPVSPPRTASCANCAANSTRWCRWPTTAPASRTAGSTTNCAGSAAAR